MEAIHLFNSSLILCVRRAPALSWTWSSVIRMRVVLPVGVCEAFRPRLPASSGDRTGNEITNEANRDRRVGMQQSESLPLVSAARIRLGT